jgi:hypothetical protein
MRTSIATATFLLLGAGAVAVQATADTTGSNIALTGSDTLFDVTQDLIKVCDGQVHGAFNAAGNLTGTGISYLGGGSGVGAGAMDNGTQEMAPMSRALKNTEYCVAANGNTAHSIESTTNAIMVAVDGVSVMANAAQSCSPALATSGRSFTYGTSSTYNITSSLQVLRLLYAGYDSVTKSYSGDFGCAGPARKALIGNWSNIFNANCAAGKCDGSVDSTGTIFQPTGLTHAWRRSDLSGTTDAFVTLVNMGTRKIGNNPVTAPTATSFTVNPFCNSVDATSPPTPATTACSANSDCVTAGAGTTCTSGVCTEACTKNADCQPTGDAFLTLNDGVCEAGFCRQGSLGAFSDYSDKDPVRVACDKGAAGDTETVCENNGTLGVVLPILLPDVANVTATDDYPTQLCDPGNTCALSPTGGGPLLACPRGGPLVFGQCYHPTIDNHDGTFNFNCIAQSFNSCFGDTKVPSPITGKNVGDGRAYNLPLKKFVASNKPGQYVRDGNGQLITGSYFRDHMTFASSYAPTGALTCQKPDDTSQIGCLVVADPCSVGYAGREADGVSTANTYLTIDGIAPRPDTNISNLLDGTAACTTNAQCTVAGYTCNTQFGQCYNETVYPLARRLYVASLEGFGNLLGGEKQLGLCFGDNNLMSTIITNRNFVNIPANSSLGRSAGAQCIDYPEFDTANANTGFLATCAADGTFTPGAGGQNTNACSGASAPTISH